MPSYLSVGKKGLISKCQHCHLIIRTSFLAVKSKVLVRVEGYRLAGYVVHPGLALRASYLALRLFQNGQNVKTLSDSTLKASLQNAFLFYALIPVSSRIANLACGMLYRRV
ncbi:hypothetical protein PoB_001278300 [Plakobranchus ocellatus]|uniref:Uncharacterized protein n=1 Tax=Plakobranchus ocellatus TaxID=259542 RepID=A0AAV3YV86_9GAST|nr:hypothetical protein PoB_001278300 [Plakobranchus ocellatus]